MARFLKKRKAAAYKAPGSLIFVGNRKLDKTLIRQIRYSEHDIQELQPETIESITTDDDHIDWINIDGLHDTTLISELGKRFEINPLYLEDILNTDQRPKIDEDANHIFITMKFLFVTEEDKKLHTDQVSFILGDKYVITFQERVGNYFEAVRERIRAGNGRIRKMKSDYLLYALMDAIADRYLETVEMIGAEIEEMDKLIYESPDSRLIERIYRFKTELNYVRKAIRPVREITNTLARSESRFLNNKSKPFLNDLNDLIIQSSEALETYYTMNSDQLGILNTLMGNRTNDVMKVLTIFAAIFIPLTFIAGIYGTNFEYVPELKFKYSYFIMWGVMIAVAIVMLLYFRRKKWL